MSTSPSASSFYRVVLTGGPCAGKTSTLATIQSHFAKQGFFVLTVPEMPTIFSQSGFNFLSCSKALFRQAEKSIIALQIAFENEYEKIAKASQQPCIVVCDRGLLDISAYLSPELWSELLRENNINAEHELLRRYDQVIHLTSTACGAESFYSHATNQFRSEGIELAQQLDNKLQNIWGVHPNHVTIGNTPTFEQKTDAVILAIEKHITER